MGKLEGRQRGEVNGAGPGDFRVIMEDREDVCEASSTSMESSIEICSVNSVASSSSSEMIEDESSTSTSNFSSSSSSNGPLYELSELMAHLPMKRGLSKFYDGKSQSYTSLASVKSLEDLAKRESPIRKKIKSCKSFGGGFDGHRSFNPRATISKKASRSRRKSNLLSGSGSAIPVKGH